MRRQNLAADMPRCGQKSRCERRATVLHVASMNRSVRMASGLLCSLVVDFICVVRPLTGSAMAQCCACFVHYTFKHITQAVVLQRFQRLSFIDVTVLGTITPLENKELCWTCLTTEDYESGIFVVQKKTL